MIQELEAGKSVVADPPVEAVSTRESDAHMEAAAAPADAPAVLNQTAPSVRRVAVVNPLMGALKTARDLVAAGTPPPKDEFTIPTPSYGAGELVDTIKLTAQYTAVNGRGFLASLTSREMRNPLFDFLKPTHALFAYFTALVNAYVRVLQVRVGHVPSEAPRCSLH
jgi:splicing factor 3A subunit 1